MVLFALLNRKFHTITAKNYFFLFFFMLFSLKSEKKATKSFSTLV